jgi:isopenicillin-N N-acyltransferase like protein
VTTETSASSPAGEGTAVLRVTGSHAEIGRQLGLACQEAIVRATTLDPEQLPRGMTITQQLKRAEPYAAATQQHFPWVMEELGAVARAADVDPSLLFAVSVEEIWPGRDSTARMPESAVHGCTDVVASGPSTTDGRTLVGHNNDLPRSTQADIRAIEWRVEGAPAVFSLGVGPWLSVSWNAAGLGVTGNELGSNDERIGVPRLLLMTVASRCRSVAEAKAVVAHPGRASSYNWVLSDRNGRVVSIEGSATAGVELGLSLDGLLHHENHYSHPAMRCYERSQSHARRSSTRGQRASELLHQLPPGRVDKADLLRVLSDHASAPDSICRHASSAHEVQTVFWTVADMADMTIDYGIGPPCESTASRFAFHPEV